ncbi:uncharacterized protein LOC126752877 [Bactrocera neohumeralis]|uniref:uncharacterized protein LOC126752877 n=1 Tax=Bactrocera neohumeralis TaxID=98809 RepID=UPI00216514ED|nr:uncharacterized protein LOC126752877 [Bactrocera neohumeralis]
MALRVTEKDEENLRQQCENASLEDKPEESRKAVLPPIRLGMSFSDWKQLKEAEEESKNNKSSRSAKDRKFAVQQRQNPRNKNWTSESHIQNNQNQERIFSRSQNYNLPNFNAVTPQRNQFENNHARNFHQDPIIPPLVPPLSFDEFLNQDVHWSSGPIMQPLFPPMPHMPRLNQYNDYNKQSEKASNRFFSQNNFSSRTKPKYGDSAVKTNIKPASTKSIQNEQPVIKNTKSEDENFTNVGQDNKRQTIRPQIYIQKPHNSTNKYDKFKSTWIVKPQAPPAMIANTPEEREQKTRLWREYRQAMKPFKNREFKNAKRVVQRLGKKTYEELDEKDRVRLERAVEAVNAHKEMLNARMVERSARIERDVKKSVTDTNNASSENVFNLPGNWHSNNSLNQNIRNTHDPVFSSRQTLSDSFQPGGVLLPGGIVTLPRP